MRKTQKSDIIKHLKRRYLSNWDAYEFYGCTQLPARIFELSKKGYEIDKKEQVVTTRYGAKVQVIKYKILKEPKNEQGTKRI